MPQESPACWSIGSDVEISANSRILDHPYISSDEFHWLPIELDRDLIMETQGHQDSKLALVAPSMEQD